MGDAEGPVSVLDGDGRSGVADVDLDLLLGDDELATAVRVDRHRHLDVAVPDDVVADVGAAQVERQRDAGMTRQTPDHRVLSVLGAA
ncbi:hypothetical protein [Actinomadura nitritigenes]|uniref:hypothetical protein n=1 Tax=Actinomadura nitritigenes TaxID=134602 RepID=UPI003D8F9545